MLMSIPQCIILEIPTNSVNDSIFIFDWVFLEIPLKNCIVGMQLTCPRGMRLCMYLFQLCCEYYSNYIIVFWPEPNCRECKVNLLEYCGLFTIHVHILVHLKFWFPWRFIFHHVMPFLTDTPLYLQQENHTCAKNQIYI